MTTHEQRRAAARTIDKTPTLTDQSQAHETDINVIVGKFGIGNTVMGNANPPMYEDFSELPTDLRGFIESRTRLEEARLALPDKLRDIPVDELVYMTPAALAERLKPDEPPKPKDEPK